MLKVNIMTQLLIFFILAISINFLALNVLIGLLIIIAVALALTKNNQFLRAIMRFKWFFLVMLLIFAFNTPGEHVEAWPLSISPSYEGIATGLTQVMRIMLMLAALNLILACNTRQELITGFYFVLSPLKYFGLKVERFVARLWLTLHYVELHDESNKQQDFMHQLRQMAVFKLDQPNETINIIFKLPQFGYLDFMVLGLLFPILYVSKVFV